MIGPVTPPDKRSLREKPSNKELLSFGRRAFLLDQRHPADRTFAWLVRVDLRMHPAGVIEVLRICLVRLFFHFIGCFLQLISDRFVYSVHICLRRRLFMIFHFHLAMLHSWHAAMIHVLHGLSTLGGARGLTQLALDRDCCLVV